MMVDVMVKCTRTTWVSWSVTVIIQPDGMVPKGKQVDDSPSTTSKATTTILLNKILGFEILDRPEKFKRM